MYIYKKIKTMKYAFLYLALAAFTFQISAQSTLKEWIEKGDKEYDEKNYSASLKSYLNGFKVVEPRDVLIYNAACSAALAGKKGKAYKLLKQAIEKGWTDKAWMNKDTDFSSINSGKKWDAVNTLVDEKIAAFEASLKYPDIRKELLAMREEDQKLRGTIRTMETEEEKEKLWDQIGEVDAKNTARMKAIIDEIGWPKISDVAKDGASAAWILVQHADRQPQFQAKCLPMLEKAFKEGEASGSNYAYLFDRVALKLGNKQRFGSQAMGTDDGMQFSPIEDEWLVNERRAEFNVNPTIEEYAERMGFEYTLPTKEEAMANEKKAVEKYEALSMQIEKDVSNEAFDEAKDKYKKLLKLNGIAKVSDYYNFVRLLVLEEEQDFKLITRNIKTALLKGGKINREFFLEPGLNTVKVQPEWEAIKELLNAMQ